MKVNEFKDDYDVQAKNTLWLDRNTTSYSEVPYTIRSTCESIGMKLFNTVQSTYGIQLFPHTNGWNSWDMNSIYIAGQTAFSENSQAWKYSDTEIDLADSKINQAITNWNLNVVWNKNIALEFKITSLKTKTEQQETSNNLKKCPYV